MFQYLLIANMTWHLNLTLQVFEDALEAFEEEETVTINNNKPSKKSHSTFKIKRSKSKKEKSDSLEEDISLEQGLIEGQQAIDLFFDNKFAESREIAQKQWVFLVLKQCQVITQIILQLW